jgi:hypothetical protein
VSVHHLGRRGIHLGRRRTGVREQELVRDRVDVGAHGQQRHGHTPAGAVLACRAVHDHATLGVGDRTQHPGERVCLLERQAHVSLTHPVDDRGAVRDRLVEAIAITAADRRTNRMASRRIGTHGNVVDPDPRADVRAVVPAQIEVGSEVDDVGDAEGGDRRAPGVTQSDEGAAPEQAVRSERPVRRREDDDLPEVPYSVDLDVRGLDHGLNCSTFWQDRVRAS